MTNFEIKEKIDANNRKIEELINPSQFVLNNTVKELLAENDALQAQCQHEFVARSLCSTPSLYRKNGGDNSNNGQDLSGRK